MAKLTNKQAAALEHILRNAEKARAYVHSERMAVCARKPIATTTLDYVRADGTALYEVERSYGSDLVSLDIAIHAMKDFLNANL